MNRRSLLLAGVVLPAATALSGTVLAAGVPLPFSLRPVPLEAVDYTYVDDEIVIGNVSHPAAVELTYQDGVREVHRTIDGFKAISLRVQAGMMAVQRFPDDSYTMRDVLTIEAELRTMTLDQRDTDTAPLYLV